MKEEETEVWSGVYQNRSKQHATERYARNVLLSFSFPHFYTHVLIVDVWLDAAVGSTITRSESQRPQAPIEVR